jgi:hypothetical protein
MTHVRATVPRAGSSHGRRHLLKGSGLVPARLADRLSDESADHVPGSRKGLAG